MDAVVNLKGTPQEFDVLRRALVSYQNSLKELVATMPHGQDKRSTMGEQLLVENLVGKLR